MKVMTVAISSSSSFTFGTPATFVSGDSSGHFEIAYNANDQKSLLVYTNPSANQPNAVVVTASGSTISLGSAVTVASETSDFSFAVYDATSQKIVVAYRATNTVKFGVATISGTSVSFGTFVNSGINFSQNPAPGVFHHNVAAGKVVLASRDGGNSNYQTYITGTVSGTDITLDTAVVYYAGTSYGASSVYDPDQQKSVLFYTNSGWNNPSAKILTVGSTTLTSGNYIGMSRGVVTGEAGSTGTAVSFESGSTQLPKVVFDSNSNRIVIAYLDGGNSDKGYAVVGTVSGTSISFGSVVIYEQGGTANIDAVFDSSNNKVVIAYQDNGDSGTGKAIVGTCHSSDNSISFGSATQFNSGANNAYNVSGTFDSSNNKVVVAYRDNGNSDYGTAVVGTVSGTSISFGTPVVFESANSSQTAVAFDSSNNKVVIAYKDEGNSSYGTAIVGTVSGTSISFGSAAVFNTGETSQIFSTFDTSNNKVVIAYRDNGNSDQGTAIVGTVSGTSISFGSEVVFNDTGNTQGIGITFDSNANKIVISYEDRGNSDKGEFVTGTVSGTSISFGTPEVFSGSNAVLHTDCGFDSNANKVVIAYQMTHIRVTGVRLS